MSSPIDFVINCGNHPTTPTEIPEVISNYKQAIVRFEQLCGRYSLVTLHRVRYGANKIANRRELLRSQGLPIDGMIKVKIPVPKVTFSNDHDHFCWECSHIKLGLRVLSNSKELAIKEFIEAMRLEAGSRDLPVKLVEYKGEFFYGKRGK